MWQMYDIISQLYDHVTDRNLENLLEKLNYILE